MLRVAVYDLKLEGVDARVGHLVASAIVQELRKHEGVSVVGMDEVRAMLKYEAEKQLLGCEAGAPCFATIGEALGVEQIVVGELSSTAERSTFSLRRINQTNARVVDSFQVNAEPQRGEEHLAAIGPAVEKLFPDLKLRAGAARGVGPDLALRINPPPLPALATIATAAGAGVLLVAGVVAGTSALSEQNTFAALLEQARAEPVQASLVKQTGERAQAWSLAANTLYAGGVLVGVAAGVMVPFTNWDM